MANFPSPFLHGSHLPLHLLSPPSLPAQDHDTDPMHHPLHRSAPSMPYSYPQGQPPFAPLAIPFLPLIPTFDNPMHPYTFAPPSFQTPPPQPARHYNPRAPSFSAPQFRPMAQRQPSSSPPLTFLRPSSAAGTPLRKMSPSPLAPRPPKRIMTVKLPIEHGEAIEGRQRSLWVREPMIGELEERKIEGEVEALSREVHFDEEKTKGGLPPTIDIYLPGQLAWAELLDELREEKELEREVDGAAADDVLPATQLAQRLQELLTPYELPMPPCMGPAMRSPLPLSPSPLSPPAFPFPLPPSLSSSTTLPPKSTAAKTLSAAVAEFKPRSSLLASSTATDLVDRPARAMDLKELTEGFGIAQEDITPSPEREKVQQQQHVRTESSATDISRTTDLTSDTRLSVGEDRTADVSGASTPRRGSLVGTTQAALGRRPSQQPRSPDHWLKGGPGDDESIVSNPSDEEESGLVGGRRPSMMPLDALAPIFEPRRSISMPEGGRGWSDHNEEETDGEKLPIEDQAGSRDRFNGFKFPSVPSSRVATIGRSVSAQPDQQSRLSDIFALDTSMAMDTQSLVAPEMQRGDRPLPPLPNSAPLRPNGFMLSLSSIGIPSPAQSPTRSQDMPRKVPRALPVPPSLPPASPLPPQPVTPDSIASYKSDTESDSSEQHWRTFENLLDRKLDRLRNELNSFADLKADLDSMKSEALLDAVVERLEGGVLRRGVGEAIELSEISRMAIVEALSGDRSSEQVQDLFEELGRKLDVASARTPDAGLSRSELEEVLASKLADRADLETPKIDLQAIGDLVRASVVPLLAQADAKQVDTAALLDQAVSRFTSALPASSAALDVDALIARLQSASPASTESTWASKLDCLEAFATEGQRLLENIRDSLADPSREGSEEKEAELVILRAQVEEARAANFELKASLIRSDEALRLAAIKREEAEERARVLAEQLRSLPEEHERECRDHADALAAKEAALTERDQLETRLAELKANSAATLGDVEARARAYDAEKELESAAQRERAVTLQGMVNELRHQAATKDERLRSAAMSESRAQAITERLIASEAATEALRARFTDLERELVMAQQTVGRELSEAHATIARLQDEVSRQEGLATGSDFGDYDESVDTFPWKASSSNKSANGAPLASALVTYPLGDALDASIASIPSVATPDLVYSPETSTYCDSILYEVVTAKAVKQADGWWCDA